MRALVPLPALTVVAESAAAKQDAGSDWPALQQEGAQLRSRYRQVNRSNPPGHEILTAHWLGEVLDRGGIEGEILDTTEIGPGRADFYARLRGTGQTRGSAPCITWTSCRRPERSGRSSGWLVSSCPACRWARR